MHGCSGGGACMVAWGGMHVCSQGGCVAAPGGHAWDTTRYGDTVNERAVRILLECILVVVKKSALQIIVCLEFAIRFSWSSSFLHKSVLFSLLIIRCAKVRRIWAIYYYF